MMILAVSRRLPQLLELQRERTWQPLEGAELRDVTVGIVGLGSIGRAVGALATAFGCRVVAVRRRPEAGGRRPPATGDEDDGAPLGEAMLDRVGGPETLPELLAESDFIVLAAPLTPETEEMINDETLGHGQARRVAHQRRPRPAHRRAGAAPGAARRAARRRRPRHVPRRAAAADVVVLRPARTSSSRRTRPGRAAGSSTGASSSSATTCAASRPASRCSTWWTRAPATDRRVTIGRMQIAIVGLAGSGKTTVFNTLTRGHAETGGFGGVTLNVGVVKVPDARLDTPGRDLQAEEDRPGRRHLRRPAGAARLDRGPHRHRGAAGRAPRPAARLRRAAPRRPRVRGPGQPASRRAASTRRATSSASTSSSSWPTWRWPSAGSSGSSDQRPPRHAGRARGDRARGGHPRAGSTPASRRARRSATSSLDADEEKAIRGFRFLTQKPVLVLLNVGEADLAGGAELVGGDRRPATPTSTRSSTPCRPGSRWSSASSSPTRRRCSWRSSGIAESGLDRVIALSYRLLGLISFLTAGPDEVRAWPIPDGSTAVDAAGGDPHRPRARASSAPRPSPYEDLLDARLDGRGAQGRQAPLRGQDLPRPRRRRAGDPVQPLNVALRAFRAAAAQPSLACRGCQMSRPGMQSSSVPPGHARDSSRLFGAGDNYSLETSLGRDASSRRGWYPARNGPCAGPPRRLRSGAVLSGGGCGRSRPGSKSTRIAL